MLLMMAVVLLRDYEAVAQQLLFLWSPILAAKPDIAISLCHYKYLYTAVLYV
jgi:hypothetical protein